MTTSPPRQQIPPPAPTTRSAAVRRRAGGTVALIAATALAPAAWGTTYAVTTELLPRGAWWGKAAVLGALNISAVYAFLFVAAELLPGGVAGTLAAVQPIMVAGLAGAGSMALGIVLTKHWGRPARVGPAALAGWQLTAGGLVLLPLAVVFEGAPPHLDGSAVAGYLWLGTVGGFIAHMLWFRGLGRLPVTAAALLVLLSPLVAAVIGALLLGEAFTAGRLAGFGLALAALLAGQLTPGRKGVPSGLPGTPATARVRLRRRTP